MASKKISFDTVRKIGLALPGVEEGTTYRSPALKVRGQLLACLAIHRSAEPGTLAVRIDFARRDEMIAADPDTYYLTDHYVDYPIVLVRLSRIHVAALRDLLGSAWRFVSEQSPVEASVERRTSPSNLVRTAFPFSGMGSPQVSENTAGHCGHRL